MEAKFTIDEKATVFCAADRLRGAIDEYWRSTGYTRLRLISNHTPLPDTDLLCIAYRELGNAMPAVGRNLRKARPSDVELLRQKTLQTQALFNQIKESGR